jgi:hypothetical protein
MINSVSSLLIFAFVICFSTLSSADDPQATNDEPVIGPAPSGPHCDWIPIQEPRPAGGQCGFNKFGAPKPGIFECGLVSNGKQCMEQCFFVKCQDV